MARSLAPTDSAAQESPSPSPAPRLSLSLALPSMRSLTFPVLVGQPVVLGIAMLKVQVPLLALLLSEVSQAVRAALGVAELKVIAEA